MHRDKGPRAPAACEAAALAYAARGWSPIPIEPRGKRPLVPWLEFQQRIADAAEIAAWFARWPDANVGIVTGRVSGIVVVDVDAQHGGLDSLRELQRAHGALPLTVEAITGGGGRHLYFALADLPLHNRVGIRPGIDLRGEGGCVVAPPSVHPSGRRYAWVDARAPDALAPAPLPAWFVALARRASPTGHPLAHWRRLVREGVAEGERNNTIASLTGHLLWHGVDPEVALELLLAWNRMRCRPPLPDDEVASVVASIARLHEREAGAGG
ncbi:MAG: bifunctional DNA primase/polymerase [Pseudomonadota bacterium]